MKVFIVPWYPNELLIGRSNGIAISGGTDTLHWTALMCFWLGLLRSGWQDQTRALLLLDHYPSATFKEIWAPVATGWSAMHCRWKSPNTNGHCVQTIGQNKMFDVPNWSEYAAFYSYRMTKSPRGLNSLQYNENYQKRPKLTLKRPAASFF